MHRPLVALILLLAASSGLAAAEISGQIELTLDGKPLRADEAQDAIVYFRPKAVPKPKPAADAVVMTTRHKQFFPRVLAVTVGSKVRFPNEDPILHNAFSSSTDNAFDVGLYSEGEGQTVTFNHAGYVRVYCNVHHSMMGHILVLDTPYFTKPDASGRFQLRGLPAGDGDFVVWHERATPFQAALAPGAHTQQNVALELTQRRVPQHLNKFGKPYGRSADGGY